MDAVASKTYKKKVSTRYSSHIPDDIAFLILSKLPLKSLTRFTSAQKSWSFLLQNPNFMNMFRINFVTSKHHDDDECLLLMQNTPRRPYHHSLCILSGETFQDRVKLDWPLPFRENDSGVHILGSASVNGFLCLFKDYYTYTLTLLWNPATHEFKTIPPSYEPYENTVCNYKPCGFGYDCIRDDYKVIRIVPCFKFFEGGWVWLPDKGSHLWESDEFLDRVLDDDEFWEGFEIDMYDEFWEIYSLRSNSWRKLDGVDLPDSWGSDGSNVNLNGYCHWFNYRNHMVSFDFTNDMFFSTTLPSDADLQIERREPRLFEFLLNKHLFELNRSVSLICGYNMPDYVQIWILGELGVKESWTKLFVVGPFTSSIMRPIGAGKKSHIFFSKRDDRLDCYDFDFRTQRISQIEAKGELGFRQIVTYKENLVPFGGMIN